MSFQPKQPYVMFSGGAISSVSGTTTTTALFTHTLKGNTLSGFDYAEIYALFSYVNSANTKTIAITIGGNTRFTLSVSTTVTCGKQIYIVNRGSQVVNADTPSVSSICFGNTGTRDVTAIDFAVDNVINFNGTLGVAANLAGESINLESWYMKVWKGGDT